MLEVVPDEQSFDGGPSAQGSETPLLSPGQVPADAAVTPVEPTEADMRAQVIAAFRALMFGHDFDRTVIEWVGAETWIYEVVGHHGGQLVGKQLRAVKTLRFATVTTPQGLQPQAASLTFAGPGEIQISPVRAQWISKLSLPGLGQLTTLLVAVDQSLKRQAAQAAGLVLPS